VKTVTLTDAVVLQLARNSAARREVPLLNGVWNSLNNKRGCGKCGRRQKLTGTVLSTRTALASSPVALRKVKKLLGADRIVLYVRGPRGLTQRREF
jgi:hypothetical protein